MKKLHGILPYLYKIGGDFLSKALFSCKMEVRRNNLKVTTKQRVEIEKDLNKGKRLITKKEFHYEEFIDEVVSSYEDDSTSDEGFIEDYKARWICKKKK